MRNEPKVSFVIPGYKCDEYIFRNVDSLFDQDYKNWEAIIVLNGSWDTKGELIKRLHEKYGTTIKLHSLDVPGLSNANNFGFTHTVGDIISHLSSDLYLMPGTIRTWVEALEENPDYGFAYSGYRFVSNDPTQVYHSCKFSRHHLECENYIDGANPVRRENWKSWNTDLKSLVDWDFALSLTDDGTKGYYLKEPLYYAELPKTGGLSDDSSRYWSKRNQQIKEAHNIPYRDICIASLRYPDYALELAEMLNVDFKMHPAFKPHEYKLIYVYDFNCEDMNIQHNSSFFMNHFGHKIVHWTGKDIRSLANLRWFDVDLYVQTVLSRLDTNYCLSRMDQRVLKRMGLDAEVIYPPMRIKDAPEKKELSISCSDEEIKDQLTKAMPDFKFFMNDLSCPVTVHFEDSINNIIQSVCNKNIVISNTDIPGSIHVQGFSNIPELRKMIVHQIRKAIKIKDEPDPYIVADFKNQVNPSNFYKKLRKIADKEVTKYGRLQEMEGLN
jgi:glycosyltransferase involved in cell wall biosynthesis